MIYLKVVQSGKPIQIANKCSGWWCVFEKEMYVCDAQCTQAQHQSPRQHRARSRTRIPRTVVCKSHNEAHRLFTNNSTMSMTVSRLAGCRLNGVIRTFSLLFKRRERKKEKIKEKASFSFSWVASSPESSTSTKAFNFQIRSSIKV